MKNSIDKDDLILQMLKMIQEQLSQHSHHFESMQDNDHTFRKEVRDEFKSIRSEIKSEFKNVRSEMKEGFNEVKENASELKKDMKSEFEKDRSEIGNLNKIKINWNGTLVAGIIASSSVVTIFLIRILSLFGIKIV